MRRSIDQKLIEWKDRKKRKPILLIGARQVGKSHSVIEFGKANYSNIALFNFEVNERLKAIFDDDLDPKRIIRELESLSQQMIVPGKTLIFFDEIQFCGRAVTSLKYFYEQVPEHHVIAAGSMLGSFLALGFVSLPVGKADTLVMYPMTFEEFLVEVNPYAIPLIEESFASDKPLILHDKMLELYRTYLFTGGMPEAVLEWKEKRDPVSVSAAHQSILSIYPGNMGKYATPAEQLKTRAVYDSMPAQLAKPNKKFQYSVIGSRARAAEYEIGLEWLRSSGLILKCMKVNKAELPLDNYKDLTSYKAYMSDVGLLNAKSGIPPVSIMAKNSVVGAEARGAMVENYVMQQLTANGLVPYYWESDGEAEIDFLVQLKENVIPIEVKSADNVRSRSLRVFVDKYSPAYSIRISLKNFGFDNNIKSVPLYAVWCIKK